MDQKELEILIGEIETRIDRLRKLYEAYFLGFEKLEPTVPRKDVDRRFADLRKEQIRNTGLRFRLNMLTQRYNTYQTQWIRICREIEEGTYKRHLQKAHARFDSRAPSRGPSKAPAAKPDFVEDSPSGVGMNFDTSELGDLDEAFSVPPQPRELQHVAVTVKPTAIPSGMSHAPKPVSIPGKALPRLQLKAPEAPRIRQPEPGSDRPAAASILGVKFLQMPETKITERRDDSAPGRATLRPTGDEKPQPTVSVRPSGPSSPSILPGARPSIRPIIRPTESRAPAPQPPAPEPPAVAPARPVPSIVPKPYVPSKAPPGPAVTLRPIGSMPPRAPVAPGEKPPPKKVDDEPLKKDGAPPPKPTK